MEHDIYERSLVIIVAKVKPDSLKLWKKHLHDDKPVIKSTLGTVVNLKNGSYVLTCFHGIRNAYELSIYKLGTRCKKYTVSKIIPACELDLALLKIDNYDDSFLDAHKFVTSYPNIKSNLMFYIKEIGKNSRVSRLCHCRVEEISNEKQVSFNVPDMPIVSVKLLDTIDEFNGISGACVFDKNGYVSGVISNIKDITKLLSIVPSVSILRLFTEVDEYDDFLGLCTLVLSSKFDKEQNGHLVVNSYDINYNNNIYTKKPDILGSNLRKHDIIQSVNGYQFDQKTGLLAINDLQIPFETYLALNCKNDDDMHIKIYRQSKKKSECKDLKIKARPLNTLRYVHILEENKYVEYAGITFVELSEELLDLYKNMGIRLSGSILKYYVRTPFRNSNAKVIVMLDVDRTKLSDKILAKFDEIGLPLINVNAQQYYVPQLTKINNKKILDMSMLNDVLNDVLSSNSKFVANFILSSKQKIKLTISDSIQVIEIINLKE